MKKEYFVIILFLLVFFIYSKKAKAEENTGGISVPDAVPVQKSWNFTYYRVQAGDTLYKICRSFVNLDEIPLLIARLQQTYNPELKTEKEMILFYAQLVAQTNGFDWNLYDDKFSKNAKDPDTLLVKQKLTIFSIQSFEYFSDNGPIWGDVQMVQGWDLLPSEYWSKHVRLNNPEDITQSFKNNPPTGV